MDKDKKIKEKDEAIRLLLKLVDELAPSYAMTDVERERIREIRRELEEGTDA